MNKIKFIFTLFIVISMAWCLDLIMIHVTKDVTGFAKTLSYAGRFAIGWFLFGDVIFKHVYKKLGE